MVVSSIASFMAYFISGLTSFGSAIVFHVIWQIAWLFVDLKNKDNIVDVVTLYTVMDLISIVQSLKMRKGSKFFLVISFLPAQLLFTFFGVELLYSLSSKSITTILGIFFLTIGLYQFLVQVNITYIGKSFRKKFNIDPQNKSHSIFIRTYLFLFPTGEHYRETPEGFMALIPCRILIAAMLVSLVSGIMRGIAATGGPPLMAFYLITGFEKEIIRGTNSLQSAISAPLVFLMYLVKKGILLSNLIHYINCFVFALIGLYVGTYFSKFFDTRSILWMLLLLTMTAALLMFDPHQYLLVGVGLFFALGFAFIVYLTVRNKQEEKKIEEEKKRLISNENTIIFKED